MKPTLNILAFAIVLIAAIFIWVLGGLVLLARLPFSVCTNLATMFFAFLMHCLDQLFNEMGKQ